MTRSHGRKTSARGQGPDISQEGSNGPGWGHTKCLGSHHLICQCPGHQGEGLCYSLYFLLSSNHLSVQALRALLLPCRKSSPYLDRGWRKGKISDRAPWTYSEGGPASSPPKFRKQCFSPRAQARERDTSQFGRSWAKYIAS